MDDRPRYLERWPGLTVRDGDRLVPASDDLQALARSYPQWPEKGALVDGRRISIATPKRTCRKHEEVLVVHVVEVEAPGRTVYVMGPKEVRGERVDGRLATAPPPASGDPLAPGIYDGVTLPSPAVDYGYDVTRYRFDTPGRHRISWELGELRSNVLEIDVTD